MARANSRQARTSVAKAKAAPAKVNGHSNGVEEPEPMDVTESVEKKVAPVPEETQSKASRKRKAPSSDESSSSPEKTSKGRKRVATEPVQQSQAKKAKLSAEDSTPAPPSLSAPDIKGGVVLAVGTGDIGQLGLGPDVMEKARVALVPGIPENIVAVAAGGLHTACLDSEGKVHTWGCNDEGALGRSTSCEEDNFDAGCVEGIDGKVVQITAGDSHTAGLTEDGRVYAWGAFRDNNGLLGFLERGNQQKTPRVMSVGNERFTMIASGYNHLVMLSRAGRVYTCGCGESGQLGRLAEMFATRDSRNRNGFDVLLQPSIVKVFRARKAVVFDAVWAGGENTFARDRDTGHIYAWGLNNYNQMGDADTNTKFQPVLMKSIKSKKWKQFTCGQHHGLAIEDTGATYSMGRHDYGRLGLGEDHKTDAVTPTLIPGLAEEKANSISAAGCVSVVVTESGKAYAFGFGTSNQLSQGNDDDCWVPTVMAGKQLQDRKVMAASVGGQHSILLAAPSTS